MSIVNELKKLRNSSLKSAVDAKLHEFKHMQSQSANKIFQELCFCLLTANYNAKGALKIQNKIGKGFCSLSQTELAEKLKHLGHRFPNARASYIAEAQKYQSEIKRALKTGNGKQAREWLVQNIKGLGMKEASHFLRNVGFTDLAIIDFHIIDLLVKNKIITRPKALTKNKYLEIEQLLKKLGKKAGMNMAELDLYLWYLETGKILK